MKPRSIMVVAGEPSGDLLAAELVRALREALPASASTAFFGAGGPRMAEAGVELAFDMTRHAVVGLVEVLRHYRGFKRLFDQLVRLALERRPDLIVCVDFSGFNRRLIRQIRWEIEVRGLASLWQPRAVQYVSPQVWASRPCRATAMARDVDLLLAIFPFEKRWYEEHVPGFNVEFVGHPIVDRHARPSPAGSRPQTVGVTAVAPRLLLLPGSRVGELKRHLPVLRSAWERLRVRHPELRASMVLPDAGLLELARAHLPAEGISIEVGGLAEALSQATIAMASTGTVTMECAWFGVPTIAFYKTSWSTYQIARRIIRVKFLAMPNILADGPLFPELIQDEATGENLAAAAEALLADPARCERIRHALASVIDSLGSPGSCQRAAKAILNLEPATFANR